MLKLRNIKKDYVLKGVPTVHALKGLTVNDSFNKKGGLCNDGKAHL